MTDSTFQAFGLSQDGERLFLQAADLAATDVRPHLTAFSTLQAGLRAAAQTTNLTALTGERDIILKHFVDSLGALRGGWLDGPHRLLDIGTGAGFPGLPLAILRPDLQVTLNDATARKVAFVSQMITALALPNAVALTGRAETLGRGPQRGQYDRVTLRAVAALPTVLELALPLLRVGGVLLALKGALGADELAAGAQAAAELQAEMTAVDRYSLPLLGDARSLVVVTKTGATPERYPRREGIPAKSPLFWTTP